MCLTLLRLKERLNNDDYRHLGDYVRVLVVEVRLFFQELVVVELITLFAECPGRTAELADLLENSGK